MSIDLFDANFYKAANSDLSNLSNEQAFDHFQTYGLNEGRKFSPYADLSFYRANNSDLANLNNSDLLNHLQNYGVAENRKFSSFFTTDFYRSNNADLAGLTNEQLVEHLRDNGLNEGRRFSQVLDLNYYGLNNPDVYYSVGGSNISLLTHFEVFGVNESRQSASEFSASYYRYAYSDLQSLSESQLYEHFQLNGVFEGRNSSERFNVNYYLENNPDLAGFNGLQGLSHYITYGKAEGRLGAPNISNLINLENNLTQVIFRSLNSDDTLNPNRFGSYVDDFTLTGYSSNQNITVTRNPVDFNYAFYPYFQIINSSTGNVVVSNDDFGFEAPQIQFTPLAGTNYIVRVFSDYYNPVGAYSLIISSQSTIVGSLVPNQSVSGNLNYSDYDNPTRENKKRDDYQLTGISAGQQVTLNLNSNDFDTYLQIVNSVTGALIGSNDDSGVDKNSLLSFTAQADTNYVARVTSFGNFETGDYTLTL